MALWIKTNGLQTQESLVQFLKCFGHRRMLFVLLDIFIRLNLGKTQITCYETKHFSRLPTLQRHFCH